MLHQAAEQGDIECLRRLLASGSDPNEYNAKGDTALHVATRNNHPAIVQELVRRKAKLNMVNWSFPFETPRSISEHVFPVVNDILAAQGGICLRTSEWVEQFSAPALHREVLMGNLEIIKILLNGDSSHDINDTSGSYGLSTLHLAAVTGNADIVQYLLDKGADVDVQDDYGNGPLHFAVANNDTKIAEMLARKAYCGMNMGLDLRNIYGKTPFQLSKERGLHGALIHYQQHKEARGYLQRIFTSERIEISTNTEEIKTLVKQGLEHVKQHHYGIDVTSSTIPPIATAKAENPSQAGSPLAQLQNMGIPQTPGPLGHSEKLNRIFQERREKKLGKNGTKSKVRQRKKRRRF